MVTTLTQDPHVVHDEREKVLEVAIGREVRTFRRRQEVTVAELAGLTGLSIGMLSKIENGNTSPSLTTLQTLANARDHVFAKTPQQRSATNFAFC